ncbi:sensor histidine kinase, partial [Clostridium perfringens]
DASNKNVKTINFDNKVISFIKLDNNWMLINEILEKDIFSTINKARISIIIFMIIGALASIVAAWVISKNTGNKVERILSKFERLEKGDFTVDRQIKSEDEFGILESKFNNTVKELEIQIKENYLCSLEAKEAHLKALQYQINPHFLYNTLEVINSI